jgi:hypothetical protein
VELPCDFAQLQLRFVDQLQWRYELIRPLVLFEGGTATQRAQETHTHPQTVRKLTRRFQQQGMLGLFPDHLDVIPAGRARRVPEAVVEEIARLKAPNRAMTSFTLAGHSADFTCRYRRASLLVDEASEPWCGTTLEG